MYLMSKQLFVVDLRPRTRSSPYGNLVILVIFANRGHFFDLLQYNSVLIR